ncbi:cell division protein, partial [Pseudomonas putida SJ3]
MAAKKKPAPKRGASRQTAPAKQPIPGWVWMAVGLTVGAFIVFLMKLEPGGEDIKRAKPEQQKVEKAAEASKPAQATPQQPVKPKYDFYTLLPESEVIVPPEAVPEKTPPVPAQPVTPVTPAEAAKIDTARAQAALLGQT